MDGLWLVSFISLWALVLLQALLLLGLAREIGTIQQHVGPIGALMSDAGLPIGTPAPNHTAVEVPSSLEVPLLTLDRDRSLLLFISPHCSPCRELVTVVNRALDDWRREASVRVICEGHAFDVHQLQEQLGVKIPMLADPNASIRAKYGEPPTPFAYLLNDVGEVLLKGVVNTREDIEYIIAGEARLGGGKRVLVSSG